MIPRLSTLLLKSACVAAVVFGISTPSTACWPFCWNSYSAYRPAYYGGYYGPTYAPGCGSACSPCGSACSPCGSGGCGFRTYYAPASCGCAPCGCAPCGGGCSTCSNGCGVDTGYAPEQGPVRDDGAAAEGEGHQTFAEEEATGTGAEEPPEPAPGDDDFGPVERDGTESTEGTADPFPEFERPVLPMDTGDGEDADPAPLNELDDEGITFRVTPTRERVHAQARYRVPHIVRLEVAPHSPWQPVRDIPAQVASN